MELKAEKLDSHHRRFASLSSLHYWKFYSVFTVQSLRIQCAQNRPASSYAHYIQSHHEAVVKTP
uniref:Uncharacterized protein n=1 Tax=Romanomermis culicivorax TaxID=13658 RepID=A0A915JVP3_ROMCU